MNRALAAARSAQATGLLSVAAAVDALKDHHPLLVGLCLLVGFVALLALIFANLARHGDDPRPHPPGCECQHIRHH